jgi:3-dehydroquinate synthetase
MSTDKALPSRQWIALPGGSCDVRMAAGMLDEASPVLKSAVGTPQRAALAVEAGVDEEVVELLLHQLSDAGFLAARIELPGGAAARSLDALHAAQTRLAQRHLTSDDLLVFVGGADVCSLGSHVAATWCGGAPLALVPLGQTALLEAPITPRALDVAGVEQLVSCRPAAKFVLYDTSCPALEDASEDAAFARCLMLVAAMCDAEPSFAHLWDRAEALVAGEAAETIDQLHETLKIRGKLISSTAIATRQSITYGESFARALRELAPEVPASVARAEALRFQARLACAQGVFEVDDVLAQDELLEQLGIGTVQVSLDPAELVAAVRTSRLARSNRFLLGLPRKLGRVRLAAVTDELLLEHAQAWCAARA